MKSKGLFSAAILTAVLCFNGSVLAGTYSGGDGSAGNPYQIANVWDFWELSYTPDDWNTSFILTANLDFFDLSGEGLASVGNYSTPFTGTFDGNGHTISNPTNTVSEDFFCLFGYVDSSGQIRNLGVENVNITGGDFVGGLVGDNRGILTSCYTTGSVSGNMFVGGLVGYNNGGYITSCYSTGSVNGLGGVGGLVGQNDGGTLSGCYAIGPVNAITDPTPIGFGIVAAVGGLVGYNGGTLTSCYSTGSVYATGKSGFVSHIGGLVGLNDQHGILSNCYSGGSVGSNGYNIGGLLGQNAGTVTFCYSTGSVGGTSSVGGMLGSNNGGTTTSCFWDINTSGTSDGVGNVDPDPAEAIGKTTAEMKTQSTFTDAGWDFTNIWWMPANSYPRLAWEQLCPMQVGQKYVYRQSDPLNNNWTVVLIVNGQATINSLNYFHLQNFNYYNESVWNDVGYVRSTSDKLYSYNPSGDEYLDFQKGVVGTKWNLYRPDEEYNYEVREIVSIESVTVPYGTFDNAYKFRNYACVDPDNLSQGQSPSWYEWIVPGVGFVKEEDYWTDGPAPVIQELTGITFIGDINNDGVVNFVDYAIFASAWKTQPGQPNWNPACDFSYPQNNIIDYYDLDLFADNWLAGS